MGNKLSHFETAVVESFCSMLASRYKAHMRDAFFGPHYEDSIRLADETWDMLQRLERYKRMFPLVTQGVLL